MSRKLDWEKANKKTSGFGCVGSEIPCDVIRKNVLNKKGKKVKILSDELFWIKDNNSTKETPKKRNLILNRLAELEKTRKSLERKREEEIAKLRKQYDKEIQKLEIEAKSLLRRIDIKHR
jgi:hypothetical protein